MLAQLQRVTTVTLLLSAVLWAFWAGTHGHLLWATAGVLLILLGYAGVLAVEFALMQLVNRNDPAPHASAKQLLRAWWAEVVTAPRVFTWQQPFRSNAFPDSVTDDTRAPRPGSTPGVLLVHGFVCNRGLWNPWLQRLGAADIPFIAVNLEPIFGNINDYVSTIDTAARRLTVATGRPPVVIAHSMGGLAVRQWLRRCDSDVHVGQIITIGSPHHGTWLGRFSCSPNTRQMRRGSAWLEDLAATENDSRRAKFTCYFSHCDNIVFPASTASLPGARNIHLPGCAHVHMARDEGIFQELLRLLAEDDPSITSCASNTKREGKA